LDVECRQKKRPAKKQDQRQEEQDQRQDQCQFVTTAGFLSGASC